MSRSHRLSRTVPPLAALAIAVTVAVTVAATAAGCDGAPPCECLRDETTGFCEASDCVDGNVVDECGALVEECAGDSPLCAESSVSGAAQCGDVGDVGDACTSEVSPFPCAEGLVCVTTDAEVASCFAPAAAGEQCAFEFFEVPCAEGLECADGGTGAVCVAACECFRDETTGFCEVTSCAGDTIVDECGAVVAVCNGSAPFCRESIVASRGECGSVGGVGDACTSEVSPFECEEGLFCIETEGEVSSCFAPAAEGEQCAFDFFQVPCAEGLECADGGTGAVCVAACECFRDETTGFCEVTSCAGNTIVDQCGALVALCGGATPLCRESIVAFRGQCGALGGVGDNCSSEASPFECQEGLFCIETEGEVSSCFAPAAAGEQCAFDFFQVPCAEGLTCPSLDAGAVCE